MDQLERLVAIQEINDLITRYALVSEDKNWDALAELWTDDAAFVAGNIAYEGRKRVLEYLTTATPDDYSGKLMNAPSLIEVGEDGTTATAKTNVAWIPQNLEITILARYNDVLVKREGRWLFRRREESLVEFKPGPPPVSESVTEAAGGSLRK